jgi:hypothetical protein
MQALPKPSLRGSGRAAAVTTIVILIGLSPSPLSTASAAAGAPSFGGDARAGTSGAEIGPSRSRTERRPATAAASALHPIPWRASRFAIRDLDADTRFEFRDRRVTTAWPPSRIHDRYGVPMRVINGHRRYHPVGLAMLGLKYLSGHRRTGKPLFLDRARRIAAALERIGMSARGAIWFPYRFTWTMHGNAHLVNRPPWYSGMSQGLALSFFVRLYESTGETRFRVLADRTYASLRNLGRRSEPWVSRIDRSRYLWIEEYPQELDRTFNGYVFALFGVYDYYQLTRDRSLYAAARNEGVLAMLRGGLTTIKSYGSTFRNPGTVSGYCLAHDYRNPKYHRVHIWQLRQLERMTGDRWFGRMADRFQADFF